MTSRSYDVIVLGLGAMGAATCWSLARRGQRVLGIERFGIPNRMGSSHGGSRVFRLAYYEHHDYVPLLQRAHVLWKALERDSGHRILRETGGVWMGPASSELVGGTRGASEAHGLDLLVHDREALRRRMPGFELPSDYVGVEERVAGVLHPEVAIASMVGLAIRDGAEIAAHERVAGWEASADGVTVRTDERVCHAQQLVVCAGAWAHELLAGIGVDLRVTRQSLCWFAPATPSRYALGQMPLWAVEHPEAGLMYGFPMLPERPGVKIAQHVPGEPADAETVDRSERDADWSAARVFLQSMLPDCNGPLIASETCMYTNSPDGHFIIDRHPEYAQVAFATGFSGHGFKFTPVVGEVLADMCIRGHTSLPAGFLSLARFGNGARR